MTTAQFLDALHHVLDRDAFREAEALAAEVPGAPQLAAELVRRDRLTQDQADRLLRAEAGHLMADTPLPKYAATSRMYHERERDVRQPSGGSGGIVFLIVALAALLLCLPAAGVVVFFFLGVGAFFAIQNQAVAPAMIEAPIAIEEALFQDAIIGAPVQGAPGEPALAPLRGLDGDTFRLSLDGAHILHGAAGKFSVSELASGKKLIDLPADRIPLGFTRDVPLEVASGGAGAMMPVILNDGVTGQEMKLCPAVRGPITHIRMLPDGDFALVVRGPDLILYNFAAVKEPAAFLTLPEEPTDLAIAGDGDAYLTGFDSGKVQLRSLKDDRKIVDYPGAIFGVACVALSPDGKQVLAGCESSVLVWQRDQPDKRRSFDHDQVQCAAFSPDGKRILSGGKTGLLRLSNADTGALVARFQHGAEMTALAFHPDGKRAITASKDKTIRVWNLPN